MTTLANPERLVHEAIAAALRPNPPVDYLDFAERHVVFDEPIPGPFDRNKFPYFAEILRALSPSDPCRYVTVISSAQIGKTTIGNIFTLGSLTMGRGTVMYCHPTDDNARRWSRMKLQSDDAGDADCGSSNFRSALATAPTMFCSRTERTAWRDSSLRGPIRRRAYHR